MSTIDIALLDAEIRQRVAHATYKKANISLLGESGLQAKIAGDKFYSNVGVWPNGCCDIESLCIATEKSEFRHYEFQSTAEAIETLVPELIAAIESAGETDAG